MRIKFDHLAIQVLHSNLENTVNWYISFFDCVKNWEQFTSFEPLTKKRLPGIQSIVELQSKSFRFHIFGRHSICEEIVSHFIQFHHLGFSVETPNEITNISNRWKELYNSNSYVFCENAYVTPKSVDTLGVESLYFTDVNGLEFEITYVPTEALYDRAYVS